jgi:hypothetical protein
MAAIKEIGLFKNEIVLMEKNTSFLCLIEILLADVSCDFEEI